MRLDDAAGHRADVGAAVAADLGLVVHAAERRCARTCGPCARAIDWPSDVLPTPGGPTKQRIGALPCGFELAHRQVLEDALLDLRRDRSDPRRGCRARFGDVDRLVLGQLPRQLDQPVEIGARPCRTRQPLPACAAVGAIPCGPAPRLPRHAGIGDRLVELGHFGGLARRLRPAPSGSRAICSRNSTSRWRSSSAALVCLPISCDSRRTSIRCANSRETLSMRAEMSSVSRNSCFSSGFTSI